MPGTKQEQIQQTVKQDPQIRRNIEKLTQGTFNGIVLHAYSFKR